MIDRRYARTLTPKSFDGGIPEEFVAPLVQAGTPGRYRLRGVDGSEMLADLSRPLDGVLRISIFPEPNSGNTLTTDNAVLMTAQGDYWNETPSVGLRWATDGAEIVSGSALFTLQCQNRSEDCSSGSGLTTWTVRFKIGADDAVYGGGQSFQGPDLRGRVRVGENRSLHGRCGTPEAYLNVPLYWSDGGWGFYLKTGAAVRADLGATTDGFGELLVEDDVLDLFVLSGNSRSLLQNYLAITGEPGRVPDWAFGIWASRASYFHASELDDVVREFSAAGCPVSVVNVDAWQSGNLFVEHTTNWDIDRLRWPQGWQERLKSQGVRLSLWLNPYVRLGTTAGDEAKSRGLLLRTSSGDFARTDSDPTRLILDLTRLETQAWWRSRVEDLVNAEGVDVLKTDFGEEIPLDAVFANGKSGHQMRNDYSLLYQELTFRALSSTPRGPRVTYSRSGTAGSQRYPCHWVGDTPSTWAGLASALRACLSLSLSGFSMVGSDVGGFWTPKGRAVSPEAFAAYDSQLFLADVDPELYARWTQWGALSPVMRFHGVGKREPWAYPQPYSDAALAACRVRAELQPDLIKAAQAARSVGLPMMRPMVLAYPETRAARDAHLQYMLGDEILVAPVLSPGGVLSLWVPPGDWQTLGGGPDLVGSGWHDVTMPLDALPAWRRRVLRSERETG